MKITRTHPQLKAGYAGASTPETPATPAEAPKDSSWLDSARTIAEPTLLTGALMGVGAASRHFLGDVVGVGVSAVAGAAVGAGYNKLKGKSLLKGAWGGMSSSVLASELMSQDFSTGLKVAGLLAPVGFAGALATHQVLKEK